MPQRICTNYGKCALAESHEDFSREKKSMTHCPLCDKKLSEVVPPSRRIAGKIAFAVGTAALLFLLFGVAVGKRWINAPQKATAAELKEAPKAILRLADSNTMQDSLGPALAEAFLKAQGATDVQILPGPDPQEKMVQGILPGDGIPSAITIAAHGSATAFTALADNTCDIGMAARKIKPDEAAKLAPAGGYRAAASEHVVGLDGIAVIVNASNPLKELRKETIRQIFTGSISDWSKIGSSHGAIQIYARDDQSAISDTFRTLVLAGAPMAASVRRFGDSDALSQAVSSDPNGIGFVSLPFIHSAKSIAVSDRGADALKPTRLTVATEEYPLSRRLYLYTPATTHNTFTQTVSAVAPDEYQELTKNAQRLSVDFRFDSGDLDQNPKVQQDLDRVVSLVADQGGARNHILLFGFTDDTGTPEGSEAASLSRAKLVERQFIQRGIKPAVVQGFGSDLPVASNDTPEGREKNRRVEVWIQK